MNLIYLVSKYFPSARVAHHDRTYEGMEWMGPGEKPKLEIFEAYQREEDRLARIAGQPIVQQNDLMRERQKQARAQAEADLVPFQQKLGEYFESERLRFRRVMEDALETKAMLSLKDHARVAWKEVTEAQEAEESEAQEYLQATAHFLAWDREKIPADVLAKREEAHKVLQRATLVYADWASLRAKEMPTREEIAEAIRKGGAHLKAIQKRCKEVSLRYPRPRKQNH